MEGFKIQTPETIEVQSPERAVHAQFEGLKEKALERIKENPTIEDISRINQI